MKHLILTGFFVVMPLLLFYRVFISQLPYSDHRELEPHLVTGDKPKLPDQPISDVPNSIRISAELEWPTGIRHQVIRINGDHPELHWRVTEGKSGKELAELWSDGIVTYTGFPLESRFCLERLPPSSDSLFTREQLLSLPPVSSIFTSVASTNGDVRSLGKKWNVLPQPGQEHSLLRTVTEQGEGALGPLQTKASFFGKTAMATVVKFLAVSDEVAIRNVSRGPLRENEVLDPRRNTEKLARWWKLSGNGLQYHDTVGRLCSVTGRMNPSVASVCPTMGLINGLLTLDNRKVDLKTELLTGVVLVSCWSINCPPCLRELPVLARIQKDYGEPAKKVHILLVSVSDRDDVLRFLKQTGIQVPVAFDPDDTCKPLSDGVYPTTLIIGRNGKLRYKAVGFDDDESEPKLRRILDELTGQGS